MEYQYPIDYSWTTDEIVDVIHFFECIEKVYDRGMERDSLFSAYRRFKEIVPGKSQEKTLFKEFEEVSGYAAYPAVKAIKETSSEDRIKLTEQKRR